MLRTGLIDGIQIIDPLQYKGHVKKSEEWSIPNTKKVR